MSIQNRYIRTFLDVEEQIAICLHVKDRHGVELIYQHYSAALMNVTLRVVRNQEIAEDVLQEALLKIWKNAHQFDRKKGSLYTWMVQICRNAAIDKTRSRDFRLTQESKEGVELVSISNQVVDETNIDHVHLRQLVGRLPDKQKELIDLCYFYGYSHKEISEKTGLPLGTVKTRIRSAIKQLRTLM